MIKNLYSQIKILLEGIQEKRTPPTISSRYLFIYNSMVYLALSCFVPEYKLIENYNKLYTYEKIKPNDLLLILELVSNKALELVNNDLESKIIKKYLDQNYINNQQEENTEFITKIYTEITYYYNKRNKDGWKKSNLQINLINENYIDPNKKLNPNTFTDMNSWCPLVNQQILGAKWGNVKGLLNNYSVNKINKKLDKIYSNIDLDSECKFVLDISQNLNNENKTIAEFWAGIGGSVTPPGFFNMFLIAYSRSENISNIKQIEYFYKLNCGLFQASIIVWQVKYKYLQCRPIQSIRLKYPNENIDYYFGNSNTDLWKPYQESRLWTPPFPDFISGHSTFSSVAACILTDLLGPNIKSKNLILSKDELLMLSPIFKNSTYQSMDLSKIIVLPGSSQIQENTPEKTIVLRFNTWDQMAESAGISRIYGGIHYPSSNKAGLLVGKLINKYMFE